MEKYSSKESSLKGFGFKEVVYCASMVVFGLIDSVRGSVAAINQKIVLPDNLPKKEMALRNVGIEVMNVLIKFDEAKIQKLFLSVFKREFDVLQNYEENVFQEKELSKFDFISADELVKSILECYPDVDFDAKTEDLINQLNHLFLEERRDFLVKVQDLYCMNADFSNLEFKELKKMAFALLNFNFHPIVEICYLEINEQIESKGAFYWENEEFVTIDLVKMQFMNSLFAFREEVSSFLTKTILLEEALNRLKSKR